MQLDDGVLAVEVADSTGVARDKVEAMLADQRAYLERVLRSDGLFFAQTVLFGKRGSDPLAEYLKDLDDPPIITWGAVDESEVVEEPVELADVVGHDEVVLCDFYGDPRAVVPAEVGNGRTLDTLQTAYRVLTEEGGHDGDDVEAVLVAYWNAVAQDGRTLSIRWEKWSTEEALEGWLVDNLDVLADFGLNIKLWSDPDTGRSGRQYKFHDNLRADLICRTAEGDWLVVELKAVTADTRTLEQIRDYMNHVKKLAGPGEKVGGLVLSDGATPEFLSELALTDEEIWHLNAGDIDTFVSQCRVQS